MANEEKTKPTHAEERKAAIQAYHDAATAEEKRAVVKKHPFLSQIYSAANHPE